MSLSESSYTPKGRSLPQRQPIARAVDSVTFSIIAYGVVVGGIVWLAYSGAQAMGYNWQLSLIHI